MLIEYKLGSFEAKLGAKITSVTSGHNVTCFDCEVMISPLFRWPNSVCHYKEPDVRSVDGVFIITDTGRKNGFEMVNGEPVQRLVEGSHSIIDILRAAETSETSIRRWWQNFLQ
ncbi:hypothetical protein GJS26_03831 [Pectobacterium carotovorum subsp. carotovorum]|nr:hypothetical protein [Pectobacterium carotovorum subsp. carotovorum]